MGNEEPRQSVSREMSGRSGFFEAIRMKCRDSGDVRNHGVFYFGRFVFHTDKILLPFAIRFTDHGHNKKLEMKGLKLFL